MSRKGVLNPKEKLERFMKDGKTPRCQRVKFPLAGKKYGVQCQKAGVRGRDYCLSHGGRSGRPVIHGDRSKFRPLPRNLQANFEKSLADPDLLNLTEALAVVDAQVWSQLEEVSKSKTSNFTDKQFKKHLALLKEKRELTKGEIERRVTIGSLMPVEDVMQIIQYLYTIINKHVTEQRTKQKIGEELRALIQPKLAAMQMKSAAVLQGADSPAP